MLKVSRETMCWQNKPCCFYWWTRSFTWNIRQFAWKTGEQTFLYCNFEEKTSFEHNFAAIGGGFYDIFDVLQNFVVFHLFSCYVYCFFEIDAFFCCWFPFFVWRRDLKAFLFAFCTNMGFVGCDWRSILINFAWNGLFWPVFCSFSGYLCHFRAFYCFFCRLLLLVMLRIGGILGFVCG